MGLLGEGGKFWADPGVVPRQLLLQGRNLRTCENYQPNQ